MIDGIDEERVAEWLVANVEGLAAPFRYERIGAGRSNLTFAVTDAAGRRFVLRRPPLGPVLATAHDMTREHRAMSAMGPTAVPVPEMLGLCTDESVNGSAFYVMSLVAGDVMDTPEKSAQVRPEVRREMTGHLVEVLAALHSLDVDAVGLGDFGRREGYVDRQIARWSKQWAGSKTRELPVVDEVAARLATRVPAQQGVGVVHGDYRFGNCVSDVDSGRIVAVLDWELCTLGDPLADLGYLGVYWSTDDGGGGGGVFDPTSVGGFGSFADVVEQYAKLSPRDVSDVNYYVAFQMWRSAVIIEGVYARHLGGQMGDGSASGEQLAYFGNATVDLAERAHAALASL